MARARLELVWSPEAEADLLNIWSWGAARFSADTADAHLLDIERAAGALIRSPLYGRDRQRLVPGLRSMVIYPTVLFYRVTDAAIEVVRVVDGRRNLAALFPNDGDA